MGIRLNWHPQRLQTHLFMWTGYHPTCLFLYACVTHAPAVPKIAGLLGWTERERSPCCWSSKCAGICMHAFARMPLHITSHGHIICMLRAIGICGPVVVICGCKYPVATSTCELECHACVYKKQVQGYGIPLEAMRPSDKKEENRRGTCHPGC